MKNMNEITAQLETVIEYYGTDDFKDNYAHCLIEDIQCNGAERMVENSRVWDVVEGREFPLTLATAERIIEHVVDNYEEFVRDYSNYYVGYDSVGSCEFGEQYEEKVEGFDAEEYEGDFYVGDDGLYYDMSSSGIHFKVTEDDAWRILDILNEEK